MDNNTPEILNKKCELFNRLYHGTAKGTGTVSTGCARLPVDTCFNFKVSDQYMCPQVGGPCSHIEKHAPRCHQPPGETGSQNLGQHHICNGEKKVETPKRVEKGFLPEKLGSLTKDGVLDLVSQLQKNPDFKYSTNMVMEGGKGMTEYFLGNLPEIVEQAGGAQDQQTSAILNQVRRSANILGQTAQDLINKLTVGEAVEGFMNYYQGKSQIPPRLEKTLKHRLDGLKQDGEIYCYLLSSLLGRVTVSDIISNCINYAHGAHGRKIMGCIEQGGGAVQNLVYGDVSDMDVYTREVMNLFDALKSTIDYLSRSFRRKMLNSRAPNRVLSYIDQIQKGLNLSLQILQHQVLTGPSQQNTQMQQTLRPIQSNWPQGRSTAMTQQQSQSPMALRNPQTQTLTAPQSRGGLTLSGGGNGVSTCNDNCDNDETTSTTTEDEDPSLYNCKDKTSCNVGGGCSRRIHKQAHASACPRCGRQICRCSLRSIPSGQKGHCAVHPLNALRPLNGDITPTVYFDPSLVPIGKHPVRSRRVWEYDVPDVMERRTCQNRKKCLSCTQPHWFPNCL